MPQFTLHLNGNKQTKNAYPYLLDVQSSLLEGLNTRVVIPVSKLSSLGGKPISNLCPVITLDGEQLVLLTQQLAGIPVSKLGKPVASLEEYRSEIISAIDFLITGI